MMGRAVSRWAPALLWAAAIFWASSQSELPRADRPLLDLLLKKGAHAASYAVFALLIQRALGPDLIRQRGRRAVVAWVLAALFAVSDEWHQSFVPGRMASAGDVLIDCVGAAVGLAVHWRLRWRGAARHEGSSAALGP